MKKASIFFLILMLSICLFSCKNTDLKKPLDHIPSTEDKNTNLDCKHSFATMRSDAATCQKEGYRKLICTECGLEKTETLALTDHIYNKATCETPSRCIHCHVTASEALGHQWDTVDCTLDGFCQRCSAKRLAYQHTWKDATCTYAKICTTCKMTEGTALSHTWEDAVCVIPKTCTACKITEGAALGHSFENGICGICNVPAPSSGLLLKENTDGGYTVVGIGTCTDTNIILPNVYNQKPVTRIGANAFKNLTDIRSVYIPFGIVSLGEDTFEGCTDLISVYIPESITGVGMNIFKNCTSLTSVTLPETITFLSGFNGCTSLTEINIPKGVTQIGQDAFRNCTSLTKVKIPSSVTIISDGAFVGCKSLTNLVIPKNVKNISNVAFGGYNAEQDIFCEAEKKPTGWENSWYADFGSERVTHWGGTWEYVDGIPTIKQ